MNPSVEFLCDSDADSHEQRKRALETTRAQQLEELALEQEGVRKEPILTSLYIAQRLRSPPSQPPRRTKFLCSLSFLTYKGRNKEEAAPTLRKDEIQLPPHLRDEALRMHRNGGSNDRLKDWLQGVQKASGTLDVETVEYGSQDANGPSNVVAASS